MKTASYTLKNEHSSATFDAFGAQMTSFRTAEREYIWQADATIWSRHAPILFPIVGKLKDDRYNYEGKTYEMSQHGFARDSKFSLVQKTHSSVLFELKDSPSSLKIYPFAFTLQVEYRLRENILTTTYSVHNPSKGEYLLFSIGAHPAFNCPIEAGQERSEFDLIFDKALSPESMNNKEGLYLESTTQHFPQSGRLPLSNSLFNDGSLTFNPNPFTKATLRHNPTQKSYLTMTFKDFPYLGIWSKSSTSPFICIEPWHGIADFVEGQKDFSQKPGILKLAPQKTFSCEYAIELL